MLIPVIKHNSIFRFLHLNLFSHITIIFFSIEVILYYHLDKIAVYRDFIVKMMKYVKIPLNRSGLLNIDISNKQGNPP